MTAVFTSIHKFVAQLLPELRICSSPNLTSCHLGRLGHFVALMMTPKNASQRAL